jgi:dsRNA-specific ribonuclease
MNDPEEKVIYQGIRGEKFKCFLENVLKLGNLKQHYIDLLTDNESLELYNIVFTDSSADPVNNYEFLETLGDSIANSCIVWYLSRRFPEINCPAGVKILSRLKQIWVSKKSFFPIGQKLNFWPFITASEDVRNTKMKPTIENVLEAFFGATAKLLDERLKQGVGYTICYNIIENIFNEIPISLKYEDLFDAKTRLKETFDWHRQVLKSNILFNEVYETEKIENLNQLTGKMDKINFVTVFNKLPNGKMIPIGKGSAPLKDDAEQHAAENALQNLNKQNLVKPVKEEYKNVKNLCKK